MRQHADELSGLGTARNALRGELPARYQESQWDAFHDRVTPLLVPGVRVLDVGSGRTPTIEPFRRPDDCLYVGLDMSPDELSIASPGAYDETVIADIVDRVPALDGGFDLVVSWQVLEHVKPLSSAFENIRGYLRPGGRLVTQFSGTFSVFGLLNRMLPHRASKWLLQTFLERDKDTVFPAFYDRCWQSALEEMLNGWSKVEVCPRFLGAEYFRFSRSLQATYLAYEEFVRRHDWENLAGYYLVDATR